MIAAGYLPYPFSEGLCNGKLVYALTEAGHHVDVISRVDDGETYSSEWTAPWDVLQPDTYLMEYPLGSKIARLWDVLYSGFKLGVGPRNGVRWVRRAYEKAEKLISEKKYDAVLTRSPNDLTHVVGYKLKKRYGIKWIANWNDPADTIWPGAYKHILSKSKERKLRKFETLMFEYADVTTFPSASLRDHFIENFPILRQKLVEVIPHIALCDAIFPRVDNHPANSKLMLLHSGNLSTERDPELTFKAMRELIDEGDDNFEFHIMGSVNTFTADKIKKYRLEDYVKCPGSFTYFDSIRKMQEYDVLVLLEAKLDKGIFFASKIVDYAQTGLPIFAISPKEGFAHDLIPTSANNEDYLDIKQKLKSLLNKKRANALESVSSGNLYQRFSCDSVIKKYESLIMQ